MPIKKIKGLKTNPDFRRRCTPASAPVDEIKRRLNELLTPALFAPLRLRDTSVQRRDRILTLPVMTALVVSIVFRQMPSLAQALRVLACEGLLWASAVRVSRQALSQRLESIPAGVFAQLFAEVIERLHRVRQHSLPKAQIGPEDYSQVQARFGVVFIADGSTLEALRRRLETLREKAVQLGGKMMMLVDAFTHVPVCAFYTQQSDQNDKTFTERLLEALPKGGLLIFDAGFFSFVFFDAFTHAGKFFVTRLREKTAYQIVRVLSQGPCYRDAIIDMGLYRSNPCEHPVRLVSLLWAGEWFHYLTNVLDPQALSARQVCELYRCRWRIEDAFLITKRLLGLAYLWVAASNGVQIQIYATWIFYSVLTDICQQVAVTLQQPLESISVEMVFRGFYHAHRAAQQGKCRDVVTFLSENAKLLGIVKAQRKRHKQTQQYLQNVWADP